MGMTHHWYEQSSTGSVMLQTRHPVEQLLRRGRGVQGCNIVSDSEARRRASSADGRTPYHLATELAAWKTGYPSLEDRLSEKTFGCRRAKASWSSEYCWLPSVLLPSLAFNSSARRRRDASAFSRASASRPRALSSACKPMKYDHHSISSIGSDAPPARRDDHGSSKRWYNSACS